MLILNIDEFLPVPHGTPLGLRIETQLRYKMVKWLKSIEFVSDYKNIWDKVFTVEIICTMA